MTNNNPLQKYFRQPKMYVSLPSKGQYYPPGALTGDPTNVPIFGMTGMDEIIMKTPDALFNGEATIKLVESCCPYIKNAKNIPSLDIDVLLLAIRMATYGDEMAITHTCKKCSSENEYDIKLGPMVEYFNGKSFNNQLKINDDIMIILKPLTYVEITKFNISNFQLQRTLYQLGEASDEDRQKSLDDIYARLADLQVDLFLMSIESVRTPDTVVTEREFIIEWLKNSQKEVYVTIKKRLEDNKAVWSLPKTNVKCAECDTATDLEIGMDQSNFFVRN